MTSLPVNRELVDAVADVGPQLIGAMSVPNTSIPKRAKRSQGFVVVLLVFLYMAQPAFGLVGLLCSDQSCGDATEHCCCESPVEMAIEIAPADTCCDDEQPVPALGDDLFSVEDCSCQVEPMPLPKSDPAVPPRASEAAGEYSPRDWLRTQAQIHSRLSAGPPGANLPTWLGIGAVGAVAPFEVGGPIACCAMNAGAWALVTRGVGGFLAVLSVARI